MILPCEIPTFISRLLSRSPSLTTSRGVGTLSAENTPVSLDEIVDWKRAAWVFTMAGSGAFAWYRIRAFPEELNQGDEEGRKEGRRWSLSLQTGFNESESRVWTCHSWDERTLSDPYRQADVTFMLFQRQIKTSFGFCACFNHKLGRFLGGNKPFKLWNLPRFDFSRNYSAIRVRFK